MGKTAKFTKGQVVRRVSGSFRDMLVGDTSIVTKCDVYGSLYLEGYGGCHDAGKFELVQGEYHVHHDLIILWAKGAEIEYKSRIGWMPASTPVWSKDKEYRIKPTNPNADKIAELEAKAQELADELAELEDNAQELADELAELKANA